MMIRSWFTGLDELLRGKATRLEVLRQGQVAIRAADLVLINVILGMITGFCVGWFALVNRQAEGLWQVLASTLKVPALFLLTFAVWDLAYYLFLYLLIGFPRSLAATDVYFMIPIAWYGPVWFPICVVMPALIAVALRLLGFGRLDSQAARAV